MQDLCDQARAANKFNVAFLGYFMLQDADACLEVLVACGRLPEAAFFARTYRPSRCSEMLSLWRTDLRSVNGRAAEALADPAEYGNLFPDWQEALEVEAAWEASQTSGAKPASAYPAYADARSRDLIALVRPLPHPRHPPALAVLCVQHSGCVLLERGCDHNSPSCMCRCECMPSPARLLM